ncbi:MAG: ABC transporter ATP-binding protein, partial [Pseudomonadota bacterium]
LVLCFIFLGLVVLNNVVKYVLNVYKGLLGERMLRRLRYDLFHRILRFRLPQFRKVSQGEIIPIITGEVEQIGGFIGEAIATPAFQGGTLLVYILFIFNQDPFLGLAAIALYPVQAYIIPKLQIRVNRLSRQRVLNTRKLADRIGEGISGIHEIHAHDASAWHLADVSERLYTNFAIRFKIFRLKYQIKFLNNFLNQLTPFFFYSIGGYLVIQDTLTFGALVAVLAAYKDLAGPWRELLTWYQQLMDMRVKYETVIENFDYSDLLPSDKLSEQRSDQRLVGDIDLASVVIETNDEAVVSDVTATLPASKAIAVVGDDESGRRELIEAIAGLLDIQGGSIRVNGADPFLLPESVSGRRIAYVRGDGFVFNGTIRGNLLYGLRNRPIVERDLSGTDADEERARRLEAERTANSPFDTLAEWDNLAAAGASDTTALDLKALHALARYGLGEQVFRMGLLGRLDPHVYPDIARAVVDTRAAFAELLASDSDLASEVEQWDASGILLSSSLFASVFGGLPADSKVDTAALLDDGRVIKALDAAGLGADLDQLGRSAAETVIELFAELPDTQLLAGFGVAGPEDVEELKELVRAPRAKQARGVNQARKRLMALALDIVPSRHRFVELPDDLAGKLEAARPKLREEIERDAPDLIAWFDRADYMAPASVLANLVFGVPRLDRVNSREKLETAVSAFLHERGLNDSVARIGLDFEVGVNGGRLTPQQRRTINLVRGLLKRPDVIVIEDLAQLPIGAADLVHEIRSELPEAMLIAGTGHEHLAFPFELVMSLEGGRVAGFGPAREVLPGWADTNGAVKALEDEMDSSSVTEETQ